MKPIRIDASKLAVEPADALEMALREPGVTATARADIRRIFFGWQNLEKATHRLAGMIGPVFPDSGKSSLLTAAVVNAAAAYSAAQALPYEEGPVAAYLDVLLDAAATALVRFDVYGTSGRDNGVLWRPSESDLTVFAGAWREVLFVPVEVSAEAAEAARVIVTSRVLLIEDAMLMALARRMRVRNGMRPLDGSTSPGAAG